MTDCTIAPATADAHEKALTTIATTVSTAGSTSSSNRVSDGDYGALFGWLATRVNSTLDDLTESVTTHSGELDKHRSEFRRNITVNQEADEGGATALTETGRR